MKVFEEHFKSKIDSFKDLKRLLLSGDFPKEDRSCSGGWYTVSALVELGAKLENRIEKLEED